MEEENRRLVLFATKMLVFALLITLLSSIAHAITITYKDLGKDKYCGYTFFNGNILINTNEKCNTNECCIGINRVTYDNILKHELRHSYFWTLPMSLRLDYCNGIYNMLCWERFANEY